MFSHATEKHKFILQSYLVWGKTGQFELRFDNFYEIYNY
jgi:hypothetical protein